MTMPHFMNCKHNGDGWCIDCVTDLQEKIDRLETQLACCADLVNSWCRETHIEESGSPYDGLELRDAVDRLWSTLAGRLGDSEYEVERLRDWKHSAMVALAEWDSVWRALGHPGEIGSSMAVESKKEVERLRAAAAELAEIHKVWRIGGKSS